MGGKEKGAPGLGCNIGEKNKYVGEQLRKATSVDLWPPPAHTYTEKQIIEFYKSLYF